MKRDAFERYIEEKYGVQPESPWMKSPEFHVFRHSGNKKWFALTMTIPKNRLGFKVDTMTDVVNLKCDPLMIGPLRDNKKIFPAYHMNKENWVTVLLDGSADSEVLIMLLGISFCMTAPKLKRRRLPSKEEDRNLM